MNEFGNPRDDFIYADEDDGYPDEIEEDDEDEDYTDDSIPASLSLMIVVFYVTCGKMR